MRKKYLVSIAGIIFEFTYDDELINLVKEKIKEISSYENQNSLTILQIAYLKNFLNAFEKIESTKKLYEEKINNINILNDIITKNSILLN